MELNKQLLLNRETWEQAGYALPQFDPERVAHTTKTAPRWLHFGAGNIFRAFPAKVLQTLLNEGEADTGVIAAEGFDYDIIEKVYRPHDNLSVLVTLNPDGSMEKTLVASVVESLVADPGWSQDWARLQQIFTTPSLQMVSFTITEKGYSLVGADGRYFPAVEQDFQQGPGQPVSYMGKVTSLLYERYRHGRHPVAMVSMDNCSHNGTKLYEAVRAYAQVWSQRGLVDQGFLAYIDNPLMVSFSWSMIDKITPRPDEQVQATLLQDGLEGVQRMVTSKNTYIAAFVNAEKPQYLVIEDAFPNGRPPLKGDGVIFTDRQTVDKVETMKVCTCLNPLHTALAIFGCLLGHTTIAEEMADPLLHKLVEVIGYREGLPVVVDPGVLNPQHFLDQVMQQRLPNRFIPDTPQRIATDTSQKLAIRFGETIKAYLRHDTLRVQDLVGIPLVLAGWCRYLLGVDDAGTPFTPSPDPLLADLMSHLQYVRLGEEIDVHGELSPILSNRRIFGVDLYQAGLGQKVEGYFAEMTAGPGAVRNTLEHHLV